MRRFAGHLVTAAVTTTGTVLMILAVEWLWPVGDEGSTLRAAEQFNNAANVLPVDVVLSSVLVPMAVFLPVVLFFAGLLPIPVGYERRKVKWVRWCGTGMHLHTVYWWGDERGFQALHPADRSEVSE